MAEDDSASAPMFNMINLDRIHQLAAEDSFWAIRGLAVQAYADLEQAVCDLFGKLLGVDRWSASIVFFRINSADSALNITSDLFEKKFSNRFNLFRNSLIKRIKSTSKERNKIVHWNSICHSITYPDHISVKMGLIHQNYYSRSENSEEITSDQMIEFRAECHFYVQTIGAFVNMYLSAQGYRMFNPESERAWRDIFEAAIVYPPPKGHPLFVQLQKPANPPQSSQA